MTSAKPELCDYCSHVDFGLLDHPTQSTFVDLLENKPVRRRSLTRYAPGRSFDDWGWSLGLQSRIDEQAHTCNFCFVITELLRQNSHVRAYWASDAQNGDPVCIAKMQQCGHVKSFKNGATSDIGSSREGDIELRGICLYWKPGDEKNLGPGIVEDLEGDGSQWPKLVECFRACTPGTLISDFPDGPIFQYEPIRSQQLAFSGRRRPERIDPKLPKEWLKNCLENHCDTCGVYTKLGPEHQDISETRESIALFRLIDVNTRALVELDDVKLSTLNFAALSYVWGGPQKTTLCTDTLCDMLKPNALEKGKVPLTINDAIDFTASVDVPYIWVDSLCILQDDESDKAAQIGHMSDIYRDALFTIVAADGQNANVGLPGVTKPRQAKQVEVSLPTNEGSAPKSLLTSLTPRKEFYMSPPQLSVWGSRGWTLQEHALSRRNVIFMDQQIFWQCHQSRWLEEVHSETRVASVSWMSMTDPGMLTQVTENMDLWRTFEVLIRNFKLRTLGDPGDAHDAFSGVLAEMKRRTGEDFLWGMPISTFEHSLCWLPYAPYSPARRVCLTRRQVTSLKKRVPFPSWSWLGWGGHHQQVARDLDTGTPDFVAFVLRNTPLRLERISALEVPKHNTELYLENISASIFELPLSRLQTFPDDQYLCFWTESVSFENAVPIVLPKKVEDTPANTKFYPCANSALLVSELIKFEPKDFIPGQDILGPLPRTVFRVLVDANGHRQVGKTQPCRWKEETGHFQLVRVATEDGKKLTFFEVEQIGGVAQRVAIGHVCPDVWDRAAPQRKIVVLN